MIADDNSIAVLPFVNMSSDQEQDYFSDGLSEELLNLLAQVPQLRVIARTSSFSFKGKEADIAEIARKLNVAHVLEGSVRKSGDTLRITAQLIRTSDSSHLWSQTYDRPMTDVFKVQDEIAAAVVDAAQDQAARRRAEGKDHGPRGLRAIPAGPRDRTASTTRSGVSSNRSTCTGRCLRIDPTYAAAWVGLASRLQRPGGHLVCIPADEGSRLAREAAQQGAGPRPETTRPPTLASVGSRSYYDRDLADGGATSRARARLGAGQSRHPRAIAAVLARRLGRLDQAIAIGEYLTARDPLNPQGHV